MSLSVHMAIGWGQIHSDQPSRSASKSAVDASTLSTGSGIVPGGRLTFDYFRRCMVRAVTLVTHLLMSDPKPIWSPDCHSAFNFHLRISTVETDCIGKRPRASCPRELHKRFNPTKFDPESFVDLVRTAG